MLKTVGNPSTRYGNQTIVDGNLVFGTAGAGIDFSANPSASGMTSELLNDYEEGTWTPVLERASGGAISGSITTYGKYIKVGSLVTLFCDVGITSISSQGTSFSSITGLPFTAGRAYIGVGPLGYNSAFLTSVMASCYVHTNGNIYFHESANTDANSTAAWKAGGFLSLTVSYYI
jgi:hypothetical protein